MNEIIYILINEAMPGYVKIGMTNNSLEERIRGLDTTSVPLPFECFYAARVTNAKECEKLLHDTFLDHRVRSNREFFEISPERVVSALRLAELENITPTLDYVESAEDQRALSQARTRRSSFNFSMLNIPIGAELVYVNDDTKKARVIRLSGRKTIALNDEETSPSLAAQHLLGYAKGVAGTLYWMYEGETLDERRRRMESGAE